LGEEEVSASGSFVSALTVPTGTIVREAGLEIGQHLADLGRIGTVGMELEEAAGLEGHEPLADGGIPVGKAAASRVNGHGNGLARLEESEASDARNGTIEDTTEFVEPVFAIEDSDAVLRIIGKSDEVLLTPPSGGGSGPGFHVCKVGIAQEVAVGSAGNGWSGKGGTLGIAEGFGSITGGGIGQASEGIRIAPEQRGGCFAQGGLIHGECGRR
jgi:hypothetical protein